MSASSRPAQLLLVGALGLLAVLLGGCGSDCELKITRGSSCTIHGIPDSSACCEDEKTIVACRVKNSSCFFLPDTSILPKVAQDCAKYTSEFNVFHADIDCKTSPKTKVAALAVGQRISTFADDAKEQQEKAKASAQDVGPNSTQAELTGILQARESTFLQAELHQQVVVADEVEEQKQHMGTAPARGELSAGANTTTMRSVGLPVGGACGQIEVPVPRLPPANQSAVTAAKPMVMGCDIWTIVGCSTAVSAAIVACGPLGPGDIACALAAISGIAGCGQCLCGSLDCPDWCPCDSEVAADPTAFQLGRCSDAGYTARTGTKQIFSQTLGSTMTFSIYQRPANMDHYMVV